MANRNKIYSEMIMETAIRVSRNVQLGNQPLNLSVPHLAEFMFDNFDVNGTNIETMFGLKKLNTNGFEYTFTLDTIKVVKWMQERTHQH
jgi:hypothetical protein